MTGNGSNSIWDDANTAFLTKLWAEGLSASQIAERIPGTTRNSVIGRIHRLKIQQGGTVKPRRSPRYHAPTKKPKGLSLHGTGGRGFEFRKPGPYVERPVIEMPLSEPDPLPHELIAFEDLLDHHCRFPISDKFCGRKKWGHSSWCSSHYWIVFQRIARHASRAPEGLWLKAMGAK